MHELMLMVVDDEIIVRRPGSFYFATFCKPDNSAQLCATNISGRNDPRIRIESPRVSRRRLEACEQEGKGTRLDYLVARPLLARCPARSRCPLLAPKRTWRPEPSDVCCWAKTGRRLYFR